MIKLMKMEAKDLFNLSDEMLRKVDEAAMAIAKEASEVETVSYGCICCGSGICTLGIADD